MAGDRGDRGPREEDGHSRETASLHQQPVEEEVEAVATISLRDGITSFPGERAAGGSVTAARRATAGRTA